MSSRATAFKMNNTFVRPEMFYISGLQDMPFVNYFYIFLVVVYILTMFSNIFVIVLIYLEQTLHSPKYFAVSQLAFADLCATTAVIPKVIDTFLFNSNFIRYDECLANMFFVHCFTAVQSLSLAILAYDRLLAICFPLQYHSINTNSRMMLIIFSVWLFTAVVIFVTVILITRLSFCKSTVINSYFCDHGPVYRLACNDTSLNFIMAFTNIVLFLFVSLAFILFTYLAIGLALLKIATSEGRQKALKTCTSHIILVAVFYIPLAVTYLMEQMHMSNSNARILNNLLSATVPPILNPVIYTLKTEEMMKSITKYVKRKQGNDGKIRTIKVLAQ
ncbi:olfactory receptor 146-like [Erpetoichthys calabaricus]|uniref:olfactory receptor 146-like n=1 Tax=Erpetoichthys calabaricus TaxID=27687 RepID=UPI0010A059EE|nr:olfactory receptor 146-like [Erpetoichthys calabaricus]